MAKKTKPQKIGIICEGQPDGAEERVLPHLIKLICPGATDEHWDIVPTGNRPNVLKSAPAIARELLADGCVAVFVVWDTHPGWADQGGSTNCVEHCETLSANIAAANMCGEPIIPVAVCQMLEAWLLADGDAVTAAMAALAGPHRIRGIKHAKNPDGINKPKSVLDRAFRNNKIGAYNENVHAGQIAARLTTVDRLRRSQSFGHFESKLRILCDGHY